MVHKLQTMLFLIVWHPVLMPFFFKKARRPLALLVGGDKISLFLA